MATLNIAQTTNFTRQFLLGINEFDFQNFHTPATATFGSSQFDDVHIARSVHVDGNSYINNIVINGTPQDANSGASFSGVGWTFTNWTNGIDTITINGTSLADTLLGTSQNDIIVGGAGREPCSAAAVTTPSSTRRPARSLRTS